MKFQNLKALSALTLTLGVASTAAHAKPFDVAFIDAMTPHHMMASMMAQMELKNGSLPEVKALARKIIADQSKEIAQMKSLRQKLAGSSTVPPVPGMMHSMKGSSKMMPGMMPGMNMSMTPGMMMGMPMKMKMDMGKMMAARGRMADKMFLSMMIPHHAAALTMAEEALTNSGNPAIRMLAGKIKDSQSEEIGKMHSIYDRRFGSLAKG